MQRAGLKRKKIGEVHIVNQGKFPTTNELKYGEIASELNEGVIFISDQKKVVPIGSGYNIDVQHKNTKTVTMTGPGNHGDVLWCDVNVSGDANNSLEIHDDGLYVVVGHGNITFTRGGSTIGTFNVNQLSNTTIDISTDASTLNGMNFNDLVTAVKNAMP